MRECSARLPHVLKRRLLRLGIVRLLVGVVCFLLGSFIRIVHCDSPSDASEIVRSSAFGAESR